MKKGIVLIIFMFLFPMSIKANLFCSSEQIVRYQKLAADMSYTYTYNENNNNVLFDIKIYNFSKELYMVEDKTGRIINSNPGIPMSEIILNNYAAGKTYKYDVYSTNTNCADEPVRTIYITLPSFNKYYSSQDCVSIEDYKLCYKWANISMNETDFKNAIDIYKKSLIKEEVKKEDKEDISLLWEFYQKYYLIILPSIIGVLMIIIISNIINKRKNDTFGF